MPWKKIKTLHPLFEKGDLIRSSTNECLYLVLDIDYNNVYVFCPLSQKIIFFPINFNFKIIGFEKLRDFNI